MRHIFQRFAPRFDRRWLVALGTAALVIAATTFIRWGSSVPHLDLLLLGPDGQFHETLVMPAGWGDSATVTADAVARFPLIFGVRNTGRVEARPGRLVLSLPARYRLTDAGGEALTGRVDPASPLITYTLDPGLDPVPPGGVPTLLPAHETLWLEAVVPRYYCVALADSIPEFVPAPPPPLESMGEVRVFYALEGGDMDVRGTGTVTIQIDPARLDVPMPGQLPSYAMEVNPDLARPELGPLQYAGTQEVLCGEPEAPMELVSTVWQTEAGARLITLEYGGVIRKHLFDLNGDGVIDRESWDPEGTGRFAATRRSSLPIPEFLMPTTPGVAYDMARFDELPADSLARLDPLRRAMAGPGPLPMERPEARDPAVAARPAGTPPGTPPGTRPGAPPGTPPATPPVEEPAPPPPPRAPQPLGRPVPDGR